MATFNVDRPAELSQAITNSAGNGQADTINIMGDITLTGLLPLIEEDVQLTINGNDNTIDGSDRHRLFFVLGGTVNFNDLTFSDGLAQGGNGGGGAAGMGGALFVFDGTVTVTDSTFQNNSARGGNGNSSGTGGNANFVTPTGNNGSIGRDADELGGDGGPGGPGGFGGDGGDGGLGGFSLSTNRGGDGGPGGPGGFGGDGIDPGPGGPGGPGGFGGGGGPGGKGSFGAAQGLGFGGNGGNGGFGGFGGGGGNGGPGNLGKLGGGGGNGGLGGGGFGGNGGGGFGGGLGGPGVPGGGGGFVNGGEIGSGGGGGGAGMGGAIFIREGELNVLNSSFNNNNARGGTGANNGRGLGGAIFALHITTNSNGNNQGMPSSLPTVTLAQVTFSDNNAANDMGGPTPPFIALGTMLDNDDLFGNRIIRTSNSSPTDINLSSSSIDENSPDNAVVGTFSTRACHQLSHITAAAR